MSGSKPIPIVHVALQAWTISTQVHMVVVVAAHLDTIDEHVLPDKARSGEAEVRLAVTVPPVQQVGVGLRLDSALPGPEGEPADILFDPTIQRGKRNQK
eukprot:5375696-Pyramimonas_sp.AAC.1